MSIRARLFRVSHAPRSIEKSRCSKIVEREDELFIVQNIVKSLEVSEEKVSYAMS